MNNDEDEANEEFPQKEKKGQKTKEEVLDEVFIKAQALKGKKVKKTEVKKKKVSTGRPFLKTGIILIIIAIAALVVIEQTPWLYIRHEANDGSSEQLFYRDFETRNPEITKINQTVLNIFNSPCNNCSNNSNNFIGLTIDDFTTTPQTTSSGFIALLLIGVIFTVFVIIDKFRNFYDEIVLAVHSLCSVGAIVACMIILISCMKFLGAYLLLHHNWSFIEISGIENVRLVFLAPIILIVLTLMTLRGSMMILKINFREMKKMFHLDKTKSPYSTYRYGGDTE